MFGLIIKLLIGFHLKHQQLLKRKVVDNLVTCYGYCL